MGKGIIKFAQSNAWNYINIFGVSAISSSFDAKIKDGFSFNGWEQSGLNYVSGMIFNKASQVSSKKTIDIYSKLDDFSLKSFSKYIQGAVQEIFKGAAENTLYNKGIAPIYGPKPSDKPEIWIPTLDKPFENSFLYYPNAIEEISISLNLNRK